MEHDYDFLIQLFPHVLNHKHLYHRQILSKKKKTITIKFLVLFPTSKAKEDKFLIVKAEGKMVHGANQNQAQEHFHKAPCKKRSIKCNDSTNVKQ